MIITTKPDDYETLEYTKKNQCNVYYGREFKIITKKLNPNKSIYIQIRPNRTHSKTMNEAGSKEFNMRRQLVMTGWSWETITATPNVPAAAEPRIAFEMDGLLDLVETILEHSEPE